MMTQAPLTLSTLNEVKTYARSLRRDLADKGSDITHARALEMIAAQMGYKDWNTLRAKLGPQPEFKPSVGDKLRGIYLKQQFSGRLTSLTERNDAKLFDVTIQLDEAIDVVAFDSFSSMRRQLMTAVDETGRSPARTSDGEPQLIILETFSDVV